LQAESPTITAACGDTFVAAKTNYCGGLRPPDRPLRPLRGLTCICGDTLCRRPTHIAGRMAECGATHSGSVSY
jgi:hypothetical protein